LVRQLAPVNPRAAREERMSLCDVPDRCAVIRDWLSFLAIAPLPGRSPQRQVRKLPSAGPWFTLESGREPGSLDGLKARL